MRLRIDPDACTGHGRCYSLVPELFEADDFGQSVLLIEEVPADLVDKAETAVSNCPERAITLDR